MPSHNVCEAMLKYMKNYPETNRGRVKRSSNSIGALEQLKDGFANAINAAGGGNKDAKQAMECWNSWKREVLKKEARYKSHHAATGGGSPSGIEFSDLENQLLDYLGPAACGSSAVKQGGLPYGTMPPLNPRPSRKRTNRQAATPSVPESQQEGEPNEKYSCSASVALKALSFENPEDDKNFGEFY